MVLLKDEGVLQRDILVPYLFIIYLDYVLRSSKILIKENVFSLKKKSQEANSSRNYNKQTKQMI